MKTKGLVGVAYKKFKQMVYYEQLDLFLRNRLAFFEEDEKFYEKMSHFEEIIESIKKGKTNLDEINELIETINFHILPKSIKCQSKNKTQKGIFLTNNKSSKKYTQKGVNYFIDAPIELHLISVIWVMKAGIFIDSDSSKSCYWFRLNEKLSKSKDESSHIFKLYSEQYAKFRNDGLKIAESILKNDKTEIAFLTLDLKHCFYSIHIDFDKVNEFLKTKITDKKELDFAIALTDILKRIHQKYREKISEFFKRSHYYIAKKPERCVIPVGLASSGILCNWHLKKFDENITNLLKPAYYGRYIDDIIIVIKNPEIKKEDEIHQFMRTYFIKNKILNYKKIDKETGYYSIKSTPEVIISEEKLTLHYYTPDHSLALLEKFKRTIDENSSAFNLLPDQELKYFVNNSSYQISYNGSSNKLRNITNIIENPTDLSINLTKIIAMLNISKPSDDILKTISDQLLTFYRGENFINFCRLWEKLFTFMLISKQYPLGAKFYTDVQETIKLITEYLPEKITILQEDEFDLTPLLKKQRTELQNYLDISISTPLGLLGLNSDVYIEAHLDQSLEVGKSWDQSENEKNLIEIYSTKFRHANLIRHNFILYPLINYSNYNYSLVDWNKFEEHFASASTSLDNKKIELSPRHLHYDEFYLFSLLQKLFHDKKMDTSSIVMNYEDLYKFNLPISIKKHKRSFKSHDDVRHILIENFYIAGYRNRGNYFKKSLEIGVANIKINEKDINASYLEPIEPNLSYKRLIDLFNLLNLTIKERCKLLILPELSIPHQWLPFLVKYARDHQMGLIFGMEYWITKKHENKKIYNCITTVLPVKNNDRYKTCSVSVRLKNHYSPYEVHLSKKYNFEIPKNKIPTYDLFAWKGCQFSVYNCYELADIEHRSIFRSELDFLVACVLNQDINYFSSIVESVVKDLHCYVVQVNCSEYGDSRILQPTNKDQMNMLRVTGGENKTVLTKTLDIKDLRDFQSTINDDERFEKTEKKVKKFKPLPPNYDRKKVRKRGQGLL